MVESMFTTPNGQELRKVAENRRGDGTRGVRVGQAFDIGSKVASAELHCGI